MTSNTKSLCDAERVLSRTHPGQRRNQYRSHQAILTALGGLGGEVARDGRLFEAKSDV